MPKIDEKDFIMIDDERGAGIALDIYNEKYSLVACRKNDKGIWMEWVHPNTKEGPSEKTFPHKITLGEGADAVNLLMKFVYMIDQGYGQGQKFPESEAEYNAGIPEPTVTPDDNWEPPF